MAIRKRGGYWHLDLSVDGRPRIRESTEIRVNLPDSRAIAQEYHDKYKADLYDKIQSGKTLADAIKLWLMAKPRSDREKNAIKIFLRIYPSRPLVNVNGLDIYDALLEKSPGNANRIMNNIRAACNMAHERKWCDEIVIPKRTEDTPPTTWLTKEQWGRLEKELQPHVLTMAKFALDTGLRLSNVTQLMWSNVHLENKLAWVEATNAKGRHLIPVPLSDKAMSVIQAQIGKHGAYVFVYENKPVKSVKTSWKKALVRAGICVVTRIHKKGVDKGKEYKTSTFRWHDLRHTWASWHTLNGTPPKALMELGAWSSIELVDRYAHLSPEHIRQYADNSGV